MNWYVTEKELDELKGNERVDVGELGRKKAAQTRKAAEAFIRKGPGTKRFKQINPPGFRAH